MVHNIRLQHIILYCIMLYQIVVQYIISYIISYNVILKSKYINILHRLMIYLIILDYQILRSVIISCEITSNQIK